MASPATSVWLNPNTGESPRRFSRPVRYGERALLSFATFGDFVSGNIWSFPIRDITSGTTVGSDRFILRRADFAPDVGAIGNISSFGVDEAGNLYIVDFDGEIFRLEARP